MKKIRFLLLGTVSAFLILVLIYPDHHPFIRNGHFLQSLNAADRNSDYFTAKMNVSISPIRTKYLICVENNICKEHPNDTIYIYRRNSDFNKRADADINPLLNTTHSGKVVPNIVHFVQYTDLAEGKTENVFEFHHMVSVLSAHKIQKPDKIYFWLDQEPRSKYWMQIKRKVPMYLVYRERPTSIRGRKIHFITKISNIIRMEAVMEYGGMYFDLDVIVVKSLEPLRRYDVTMGKEESDQMCNGIIIARPWADFLRKWHQEHMYIDERVWSWTSGKVPYILSRRFPGLVHVEETSLFRPAWYEMNALYKEGQLYDWRKNSYCVHIWIRKFNGKKPTDSGIDGWNTTVGEIYRYILYDDWRIR